MQFPLSGAVVLFAASQVASVAQAQSWDLTAYGTTYGPVNELIGTATSGFVASRYVPGSTVATWNGTAWTTLGTPPTLSNCLTQRPNGDLVSGGIGVSRWNGTSWASLGGGFNAQVYGVQARQNGNVVAAGAFTSPALGVAEWSGSSWSALSTPLSTCLIVRDCELLPNGDVALCGVFTVGGLSNFAIWNGSSWSTLGTPPSSASGNDVHVRPNGNVVLAYDDEIAEWDGANWTTIATAIAAAGPVGASIYDMCDLADGSLVVGGIFTTINSVAAASVARWDGATWSSLCGQMWANAVYEGFVYSLSWFEEGVLVVGGDYSHVNVAPVTTNAYGIANIDPAVLASATNVPSGCSGGGGLNTLTPVVLPWIGSTYTANATGLATSAGSVAIQLLGWTNPNIAIPLPDAVAGCLLLSSSEILTFLPAIVGGATQATFAFPFDPLLTGLTMFHQVGCVEVITGGQQITSTNGLQLTIGQFQ